MAPKRRSSSKAEQNGTKKGSEATSRRTSTPPSQQEAPPSKAKTPVGEPNLAVAHYAQVTFIFGRQQSEGDLRKMQVDPTITSCDVDYLKIYNSEICPWFMEGVRQLQSEDISYPARSHGLDKRLATIHNEHPKLAFGFAEEDGSIKAWPMLDYESAGLWEDEAKEVCLVVKPTFEDGWDGMLLLYKSNLVEDEQDVVHECQWCVLKGKGSKSKKRKTK